MKIKPKGRKIYKTKEKNYYGKSTMGKILSGALTVLLIGGIGFIGYSVAEPVINYTQHKGDRPAPEPTEPEPDDQLTTDPSGAPVADPSDPDKPAVVYDDYRAAVIPESAMTSLEDLSYAVSAVPKNQNIEYIEIPLKVRGGKLLYSSYIPEAQYSGASETDITLAEIAMVVMNNGYKPAALISTLEDSIFPSNYPGTGYVTIDDGSQWIDDLLENGGKPWITPYSPSALEYLSGIVGEAASAGFERIVCTDLKYPYFRESDLALLDVRLGRNDRCMALTSAANLFYGTAVSKGASMLVEVSAADLIRGNADVLQPMLLSASSIVLNIDIDELSEGISDGNTLYDFSGPADEITEKCLGIVKNKLSDFNVTVRISGAGQSMEQLLRAKDKTAGLGYRSYVIG